MRIFLMLGLVLAALAAPAAATESSVARDLAAPASADLRPGLVAFARAGMADLSPDGLPTWQGEAGGPRRWWPLVLSAAVPGLGEAITGHWWGYGMIAADGGLLFAALDKRQEGEDLEDEYKAFADEHYSEDEWRLALSQGDLEPYFPRLTAGSSAEDVDLYVTKEEDEREWYENIGKWDQFAWGWREYWEEDFDPGDPANPDFITPLRQKYVDLRGESNDAFGRSDTYLTISLLLRVASVLQMAYLEGFIGGRYNEGPGLDDPGQVLVVSDVVRDQTRFGLQVSY